MAEPAWRHFERVIQGIFERNPKAKVQRDAVVVGRSGRERKLELFVEYPFEIPFADGFTARVPIKIAVDCKNYGKAVGIKKVEEFAGQMDDVGAAVGIMVAPNGFDSGAKARAPQLNIYLIDAPWDILALASGIGKPPHFHECTACSEARADRDGLGGIVYWGFPPSRHSPVWGNCDWCNVPHAICPDCGGITGFCEPDFDEWIECAGGCDRVYRVRYDSHDGGDQKETFSGVQRKLLLEGSVSAALSRERVNEILSATKWRYADGGGYDPVTELQDAGLILKVEEGFLLHESALGLVEDELPKARDAFYW